MKNRKYTKYEVAFEQFIPTEAEMFCNHRGREYLGTLDVKNKELHVREWTMGGREWSNDHMSKSALESMVFKLAEKGFNTDEIEVITHDID